MEKLYKVQNRFLFHANIKIKIPNKFDEKIFDELFRILENINEKYNSYSEKSYIYKINKNAGEYVDVDKETIEILEKVKYFSDFFEGEYDITIMPLIRLWGFYKENVRNIPSNKELEEIKKMVDYKKIKIDKQNLRVKIDKNQEIITGSFIKSYAIDKLVNEMKKRGMYDSVINAGGSSILNVNDEESLGIIVENPENTKEITRDKNGFAIEISNKDYKGTDKYNDLFDIEIFNEAYSTSNQKNTYILINGEKYGHIISPKTGFPSNNKQIGIITEKAFFGDIISTGLYNQTPENFLKIIEKLSKEIKVEGYLIDEVGRIFYSKNFKKYIEN